MTCRVLAFVAVALTVGLGAVAVADPTVVVFTQEGCPDCERMKPVIEELAAAYPSLGFRTISDSDPDAMRLWSLAASYGVLPSHFPVIFVGRTAIVGASRENELRLRNAVAECASAGCPSPLPLQEAPRVPWRAALIVGAAVVLLLFVLFGRGT